MTQEKWGQLRQKLLKTVGQNNYTTWIEPLEFEKEMPADDPLLAPFRQVATQAVHQLKGTLAQVNLALVQRFDH